MERLIIRGQNLTGQTIKGKPFSYVGECVGSDIKWIGDWMHVSLYGNTFLRPDWSGAQTRWSYSRENIFTDIIASPDAEIQDHEMMAALMTKGLSVLTGKNRTAAQTVIDALKNDIAQRSYSLGWANYVPRLMAALKMDISNTKTIWGQLIGERKHLIDHLEQMANENPLTVCWSDAEPLSPPEGGILSSPWGIAARNPDGREYVRRWSELPVPKNPHDRLEMAELTEAEVEAAVGFPVTLYIQQILRWRCRAVAGKVAREDLAP